MRLLAKAAAQEPWPREPRRVQLDRRSHMQKKLTDCPFWTAYGGRGRAPEASPSFHKEPFFNIIAGS